MSTEQEQLFLPDSTTDANSKDIEIIDLSSFEIMKPESFSLKDCLRMIIRPSVITFNKTCLEQLSNVEHIDFSMDADNKRIIVHPCEENAQGAIRWCKGIDEKDLQKIEIRGTALVNKVYDVMKWTAEYRYEILGRLEARDSKQFLVFELKDYILLV